MKPMERREEIVALVARSGRAAVEDLAMRFGVSVETVRRDLSTLAEEGLVRKIHGGAMPAAPLRTEGSFQERMAEDEDAKRLIAAKLSAEIRPGDTLFLDTGSTTLIAAEALSRIPSLTVITNSLDVARLLGRAESGAQVWLLGGAYAEGNAQTVGAMALEQIARFSADHAVLTVAALDARDGAMDADPAEAEIARAMIARARRTIVLATGAKMMRRAAHRVCGLDAVDLVLTESAPDPAMAEALAAAGVTLR